MTQNNSAVSTQATQTQTEQNQNQQTMPKGFVTDSRTRGEVKGLGLIAVRSAQDSDGNVEVEELVGEHERGRKTTIPANSVKPVSNKPGSAKASSEYGHLAEDDQESLLNLARRLAGDSPRQTRTTANQQEIPWLGAITGLENVRMWVEQKNGNLYLLIEEFTTNPLGVGPRSAELNALEKGGLSWEQVRDDRGNLKGSVTTTKTVIVLKK